MKSFRHARAGPSLRSVNHLLGRHLALRAAPRKRPGLGRVSTEGSALLSYGLLPVGNGHAAAGLSAVLAAGGAGAVGAAGAAFLAAFFAVGLAALFFAAAFLA